MPTAAKKRERSTAAMPSPEDTRGFNWFGAIVARSTENSVIMGIPVCMVTSDFSLIQQNLSLASPSAPCNKIPAYMRLCLHQLLLVEIAFRKDITMLKLDANYYFIVLYSQAPRLSPLLSISRPC